jgi:hypothetical protein
MDTKSKPGPKPETYEDRDNAVMATAKAKGDKKAAEMWGLSLWSIRAIRRKVKAREAENA